MTWHYPFAGGFMIGMVVGIFILYIVQRFVPRHTHDFGPWETASAKYNYLRHGKLLEVQNTVQLRRCRDPNCQKLELQQFE